MGFGLFHPVEGNSRPLGDDVHDIIVGDGHDLLFAVGFPFLENAVQFFFGLFFGIAEGGCSLKVLVFDGRLFISADGLNFFLQVFDVRRARHGSDTGAGACFVHDIDCFVREESTGEVTV